MAEAFELAVQYKGVERSFPAELRPFGFSYKIWVKVGEAELLFEPDEERNFRAVLHNEIPIHSHPDPELVAAIAAELESQLKP